MGFINKPTNITGAHPLGHPFCGDLCWLPRFVRRRADSCCHCWRICCSCRCRLLAVQPLHDLHWNSNDCYEMLWVKSLTLSPFQRKQTLRMAETFARLWVKSLVPGMVHYSIAVFFGCLFIPQNMEIIGVEWLWPIPKYQISPGHCHTNPSADSWNIFVDVAGDVAGGDAQKHILVGPDFKQMRCLKLDLHLKKVHPNMMQCEAPQL